MSVRITKTQNVPQRYIPKNISVKDKKKQARELRKSRKLYKKGIFYQRASLKSFHSKPSSHVKNAMKLYNVENMAPTKSLSTKTGCTRKSLEKIINKGEGAFFSSGSRPNQTAQSWGYARLASAITGANASIVDYGILKNGCKPSSKALKLATITKKKRVHF